MTKEQQEESIAKLRQKEKDAESRKPKPRIRKSNPEEWKRLDAVHAEHEEFGDALRNIHIFLTGGMDPSDTDDCCGDDIFRMVKTAIEESKQSLLDQFAIGALRQLKWAGGATASTLAEKAYALAFEMAAERERLRNVSPK